MADKNCVYDVLRMPMMTEDRNMKERAAAIVRRLVPLVREEALLTPGQAAHLVVTIHSLAASGREMSDIEICALAAFASSCG